MASFIKNLFTPTGNVKADTNRALVYAKSVNMDEANTKMAVVMATEGADAGAKAMINEHTSPDGKFDYFAMRARYG